MADFDLPPLRNDDAYNPFAAPESDTPAPAAAPTEIAEAERIRNEHISAEASIRAIGLLDRIGAIFLIFAGLGLLYLGIIGYARDQGYTAGMGSFYLIIGIFNYWMGTALRNLKNWARITNAILCIPGIVNPIVWLILYYLLNKKAAFVCTPQYAEIRAMTPHIKYKTSIIVKFLVFLLMLVFIVIIVAAISSSMR